MKTKWVLLSISWICFVNRMGSLWFDLGWNHGFCLRWKFRISWWVWKGMAKWCLSFGVLVFSDFSLCLILYCWLLEFWMDFHGMDRLGCSLGGLDFGGLVWRSLGRFDVVFLELSLVINSLSLENIWADLDGCFWWNPNLILGWWFDYVGC